MGPRPNMTRVRINRGETDVYRRRSGGIREKVRREGRGSRREEGGSVSYYFRFAYVSCFSPLCSECGVHQRRARSKKRKKKRKGRARERRRKGKMTSVEGKGDGRISGRNRNVLLLPRTPTIEAKYARTVTDKVVVAMRKHRARANPRRERSFFPSLLPAPSETN